MIRKSKRIHLTASASKIPSDLTALIARIAVGVVGLEGLPWIIALLVILTEFFGALMLIAGLGTRLAAIGIIVNFLGVVLTSHIHNGFFMNWYSAPNKGEGVEFFLLLFGLAIISLIAGGGKASLE